MERYIDPYNSYRGFVNRLMSDERKIGNVVSFGLTWCMGLFVGLIFFNPSEGFIIWWGSINWSDQDLAWVSGIGSIIAAIATASAALSSSKAADAATRSANQWKEHASYDKYIDTSVKARIKLRWLEAHLMHMCDKSFIVSYEKENLPSTLNDANSFLSCLQPQFVYEDPSKVDRFNNYKKSFKYQSDRINEIYLDSFNLVEETYELSKNHVGITEPEKKAIFITIEELIKQLELISSLYRNIFDEKSNNRSRKKSLIDGNLNCQGASQHHYRLTLSNIRLITGYIDHLIIDSKPENWSATKSQHINEQLEVAKFVSNGSSSLDEILESIALKFERP